jgi:hypothetical protein
MSVVRSSLSIRSSRRAERIAFRTVTTGHEAFGALPSIFGTLAPWRSGQISPLFMSDNGWLRSR